MRRFRLPLTAGLALAAVLGLASCATDVLEPSPPPPPQHGLIGDLLGKVSGTLLLCAPQEESTTTKTIGKQGGTINMGTHTLSIPSGALSGNVTISGTVVRGSVNSVRLEPHGLKFAKGKPATLTMSYSNCLLKDLAIAKKVAYTSEGLDLLAILKSLDFASEDKVQTKLNHFSRYAIAY
jgi:hypothetical protein